MKNVQKCMRFVKFSNFPMSCLFCQNMSAKPEISSKMWDFLGKLVKIIDR